MRGGPVLFIAAEGGRGIVERLNVYAKHYGIDPKDIPLYVLPQAVDLCSSDGDISDLIRQIHATGIGAFALIVIDTASRAMAGGDENSAIDVGRLIKHCGRFQAETGAHVMLIHHFGKDQRKGPRGHSSLAAALDTEIRVERDRSGVKMTIKKQRDGKGGDVFHFSPVMVDLGVDQDGELRTSLVVVPANGIESASGATKLPRSAQIAFQTFQEALETAGRPPRTTDGAPQGVSSVVDLEFLRSRCYELQISRKGTARARQKAFRVALEKLDELKLVGSSGSAAWLMRRDSEH